MPDSYFTGPDGFCDKLLAGTAFSADQDRKIRSGDLADILWYFEHERVPGDDSLGLGLSFDLRLENKIFGEKRFFRRSDEDSL